METTFQAGRESSAKQSGELKEAIARIMASATEVGSKADALLLSPFTRAEQTTRQLGRTGTASNT